MNSNNITKEKFSFLPKKENTFSLPENYFENSEKELINKLLYNDELMEFQILQSLQKHKKEIPFTDYFASSEKQIVEKIERLEELNNWKKLNSITNSFPFGLTTGYFDTLADNVKERFYNQQQHKSSFFIQLVNLILKPKIAVSFLLFFGVLFLGVNYINKKEISTNNDCKTLACLEKRELLNEKIIDGMNDENLYEMVDVENLDKQLSSDSTITGINEKMDTK